jgi:hypothetical protein
MSPEELDIHPPHGPARLEGGGRDPGRTISSRPSRGEAIGRLEQLRKVVPVFAHELVSARREAAQLRTENAWLHEQLRERQGHPEESSLRDARAALHERDQRLGESRGRVERENQSARSGKTPK